jgi:Tfp pilus assembly protein PilE
MRRVTLRILDLLIIISFFVLLFILVKPQYQNAKITTKRRKLQANMFIVKAAIERCRAFNEGKIPFDIYDIYENIGALENPINPYTLKKLEPYDITKFGYDVPSQVESTDTNDINGEQRGNPGGICIGFYITITPEDTVPINYGILGFDFDGKPLTLKEGDKVRVVVLTE